MDDTGERGPLSVRDFPIVLREQLAQEAKGRGLTVGDFLAGIVIAAREGGWTHAVPLKNGRTAAAPAPAATEIAALVEAVCRLASTKNVPKSLRTAANRTLERHLAPLAIEAPSGEPPAPGPAGAAAEEAKGDDL